MARKHTPQTVELVRELACTMTDIQIAEHFKKTGLHTPEEGCLQSTLKWIRYLHHIPALSKRNRGLAVKEVAKRFSIGIHTVYYWIERGVLDAKKVAPGWPWDIEIDKQKDKELQEWVQNSGHLAKIRVPFMKYIVNSKTILEGVQYEVTVRKVHQYMCVRGSVYGKTTGSVRGSKQSLHNTKYFERSVETVYSTG